MRGGQLGSGVQLQLWLTGLWLCWLLCTQKATAWPQPLFPAHVSKPTLPQPASLLQTTAQGSPSAKYF